MRAAAYCRVSTKSEEQLDSLESQETFFLEYARRNEYELVHIYADEGKSGTKMKNRTDLLHLLKDAAEGKFEFVLIKDISRLARNTVDFLTSIRQLKALGITVIFVNYDQTSSESSEFMLTMLSAIAQEESANTSKRVKFGKKLNARMGRVPNFVYGYDKIPGEYFDLKINEKEAETVRRIFYLYTNKQKGTSKIAEILNNEKIKTKKGCSWNQAGICRILCNEIYMGTVINGKEEIEDFLTGKRKRNRSDDWYIIDKPELKIIEEEVFKKAQAIREGRKHKDNGRKKSESCKHPFSQLIVCSECKGYFRRLSRTYKNTINTWVCGTRNKNGAASCVNVTSIKEEELLNVLFAYFTDILKSSPPVAESLLKEGEAYVLDGMLYKIRELRKEICKKEKERSKYIELYTCEVIDIEELKAHTDRIKDELGKLNLELEKKEERRESATANGEFINPDDEDKRLESYITQTFSNNLNLKRILERVEADSKGNVVICLKNFSQKKME